MSFDYTDMAATAQELIAEFGCPASLRRMEASGTGPAHNPDPAEPSDSPVMVVVSTYKAFEIDGQRVLKGDRKVILAPVAGMPDPTPSDQLIIDDARWSIQDVQVIAPGAMTLVWKIQIRK